MSLKSLLRDVRACAICEAVLPFGGPASSTAGEFRKVVNH
jgi:hypothetical protein